MAVNHTLECERMNRVAQRVRQALVSAVAARRRLDRIMVDLRNHAGTKDASESDWRCWY